jgi:hypothetical protein
MVEYYMHNELGDTNKKGCKCMQLTSIRNHIDASIHVYVVQN